MSKPLPTTNRELNNMVLDFCKNECKYRCESPVTHIFDWCKLLQEGRICPLADFQTSVICSKGEDGSLFLVDDEMACENCISYVHKKDADGDYRCTNPYNETGKAFAFGACPYHKDCRMYRRYSQ